MSEESDCPHDDLEGDEGPVAELGRMPVRWRCRGCGRIEILESAHPGEGT